MTIPAAAAASPAVAGVEEQFHAALMLHRQSRLDDARVAYEQVLSRQPQHVQALTFLAVLALESNDPGRTLELTSKALRADSRSVATQLTHAHALARLRRGAEAVAAYDRTIALVPDFADAYFHRGNVLHELSRHADAVASYDKAIQLKPGGAELYNNRGNALRRLRRYDDAIASYDRAIATRADYAQAHSNRGNLLSELERFDAALASYDAAIAAAPDYADALCNRGNLLGDLGRYDEALASLDRALAVDPGHALAHFSRSLVRLLLGDLPGGWRDFEWRWENEHCITSKEKRGFAQPLWRGERIPTGARILVHCEQGLGDTIQFCRYAELVADLGATVILEAPPELRTLLGSLRGVTQLIARGEPLPFFDYYCPLMSLPMALKTTVDTIPASVPYLRCGRARAEYWRDRLGARSKPRVGLVWSGGFRPGQPELWSVNNRRNIPLARLAALRHPDIEFYSLQKGQPAEGELAELAAQHWNGPELADYTHELRDFEDTAALIEQLDLVISVDTSTAHLAGALGKPVWLLNRFDTCWRWLLDRTDSPWYPSLRLYRQERRGDWESVVRNVRRDLERLARDGNVTA